MIDGATALLLGGVVITGIAFGCALGGQPRGTSPIGKVNPQPPRPTPPPPPGREGDLR